MKGCFSRIAIIVSACCVLTGCAGLMKKPVCTGNRQDCIEQSIEKARIHAEQNRWASAVDLLESARRQFPDAPELRKKLRQYESTRRQIIFENELEILLEQGRHLLSIRENQEKLFSAQHDTYQARRMYNQFRESVQQTADRLFQKGIEARQEQRTKTARRVLALSNRLKPSPAARDLLSEIQLVQQDRRIKTSLKKKSQKQNKWSVMAEDFSRAMEKGDLGAAGKILSEMKSLEPEKSRDLEKRLEKRIDQRVETLLARGRFLYTRGDLKQALEVWQQGLELRPDDPRLLQNIRRARTFIDNLDRWGQ